MSGERPVWVALLALARAAVDVGMPDLGRLVHAWPADGCGTLQPPPSPSAGSDGAGAASRWYHDAVVLARRGGCSFATKASVAKAAGAAAVVIANIEPHSNAEDAFHEHQSTGGTGVGTAAAGAIEVAATAAASRAAAAGEEEPFFMVANPGEGRGLNRLPVVSIGGLDGRWVRSALMLAGDESVLQFGWAVRPRFSAEGGRTPSSATATTGAAADMAITGASDLRDLVKWLDPRVMGQEHGKADAGTAGGMALPQGARLGKDAPPGVVGADSHAGAQTSTDADMAGGKVEGGHGDDLGESEDTVVRNSPGSLELAAEFAKMGDPRRAAAELSKVARSSAARANMAAQWLGPRGAGGSKRSGTALSGSLRAAAYSDMRSAHAQEAKALLLLAWLQQDECDWTALTEQQQGRRQKQRKGRDLGSMSFPSVLHRLQWLVTDWGWGGAATAATTGDAAPGAAAPGTTGAPARDPSENDATGAGDEDDATGAGDEDDVTGAGDEDDVTGAGDEDNTTGAGDEDDVTGAGDEDDAKGAGDEDDVTDDGDAAYAKNSMGGK
eukprot:g100.t1